MVFQNPSLDKKLTVEENLRHQGHLYGLSGVVLKTRIEARLQNFNLLERRHDFIEHLSGGLQRRVEIAKGLLHEPELQLPPIGVDGRCR